MVGPPRKGLSREEYADAIMEIRLKKARGEVLDRREEVLWAYRHAGSCHHGSCRHKEYNSG